MIRRGPVVTAEILKRLRLLTPASEDSLAKNLESRAFEMSAYLIKPREPTVLSHKEYHELSSTNLLVPLVVRLLLLNGIPRSYADS